MSIMDQLRKPLQPVRLGAAAAFVLAPLLNGCALPSTVTQPTVASACHQAGGGLNDTELLAVLSAAGGAALGYFTDSQNRAQGVLFGATGGALFGAAIGAQLDAQDCQALTDRLDLALQTGQETRFDATSADVPARIVPSRPTYETVQFTIKRAPGVAPPNDLHIIGRIGYAREDASILSAPGTSDATVLGSVAASAPVRIVGYPRPGSAYDLIAEGGIAVGYVKSSALTTIRPAGIDPSAPANIETVAPVRAKPDLDADSGDPDETEATATIPCRSVAVTTTASSAGAAPATNSANVCQTPDGAWNKQDALADQGA